MQMRLFLFVLLFPVASIMSAQDVVWTGKVLNEDSQEAIAFAVIWDEGARIGESSTTDGSFRIRLEKGKSYAFKVTEVAHLERIVRISPEMTAAGNFSQDILLKSNVNTIGLAIVEDVKTVFADPRLHVADFQFWDEGMILLTYDDQKFTKAAHLADKDVFEGCELILLGAIGDVLLRRSLPMACIELFQDFRGDSYLRTLEGDYLISREDDHIFLDKLDRNELENYVRPLVDSLDYHLYASTFVADFPAFEYQAIDLRDTTRQRLRYVVDEVLMEQFKSEYKWLTPRQKLEAFRAEVYHGIEKEIAGAYISGFTNSIYWDELYAPLVVFGDTIYIFDHYANMLFRFDSAHTALRPLEIDYHLGRRSGWEEEVIFDKALKKAYGHFLIQGHPVLKEVNLKTGEVDEGCKLTFKFAENIRIQDGWAYYTYRPHASSQTRYLYKEEVCRRGFAAKKE